LIYELKTLIKMVEMYDAEDELLAQMGLVKGEQGT